MQPSSFSIDNSANQSSESGVEFIDENGKQLPEI
jgi:hypothetical protein